jgi:Galactose oxidase, central domain
MGRGRGLGVVLVVVGSVFVVFVAAAAASGSAAYFSLLPETGSTYMQYVQGGAVSASLPDGRVLIAGGANDSGDSIRGAELFDSATDSFTVLTENPGTELTVARYGAIAAPLPDGDVLIAGGYDGTNVLTSAELYDPTTEMFSPISAQLNTGREGAAAASLPNGDVLIAGGLSQSGTILRSAELFDPSSGSFVALTPGGSTELQTGAAFAAAAPLPNGDVLIAGGEDPGPLASAEVFDPSSGTFATLSASLNAARAEAVASPLADGDVLITGGANDTATYLQSAELFDPSTKTFAALPASGNTELQHPRNRAVAALLPNGEVLEAGGFGTNPAPGYVDVSAELFVSAPQAATSGGAFGNQVLSDPSSEQTMVVTNVGAQVLRIGGAVLGQTGNPGDFAITADECGGKALAYGESCTITAQFTPTAAGARSASVVLEDNEQTPASIALNGTGTPANAGPTGPTGPRGPAGKNGEIKLVTCRSVTVTVRRGGKRVKVKRQRCSTKIITGTASFTTARADARLARGQVTYATGNETSWRVTLKAVRPVRNGRYTLILTHRSGTRDITTRQEIRVR